MPDGDQVVGRFTLLLHDDRIGAFRNQRAGEDARGRPGQQRLSDMASRNPLRHRQRGAAAGTIGGAHRVTIHLRVVHGRHVHAGDLGVGQHPAIRFQCRYDLGLLERTRGGGHEGQCLGHSEHRFRLVWAHGLSFYSPVLAAM